VLNNLLVAGAAAISLIFPATSTTFPSTDSTVAPSGKIVIDLVTVNGTGCPAGSAAVAVSPDNTAFTVTYSKYIAQVGPNIAATEARKNCQLNVLVHAPQGFTYAISKVDYRGYANLAAGATALERANYYFSGMSTTTYISHPFTGPLNDDWQTTDVADLTAMVWSPCGAQRNLNINTELRAAAGTSDKTATSLIQMDSADTDIQTVYHLSWDKCTK
jgi:hypothetical protein